MSALPIIKMAVGLTFAALCGISTASAQHQESTAPQQEPAPLQYYYSYFKERIPLDLDTARIALFRKEGALPASLQSLGIDMANVHPWAIPGWSLSASPLQLQHDAGVKTTVRQVAELTGGVDFVSPVFLDSNGPVLVTRDLFVGFDDRVTAAQATAMLRSSGAGQITAVDYAGLKNVYRIRSASRSGFEVLDTANALARQERVRFAEPDLIRTLRKNAVFPNDEHFFRQWALHNTGQEIFDGIADVCPDCEALCQFFFQLSCQDVPGSGIPGFDMDAPEAWDLTTGDPDIIIAVFDDGVQLDHPDLMIDPALGADFTGSHSGGFPVVPCDVHGTLVAGTIGARIDNGVGVAGIAPECTLASAKIGISGLGQPPGGCPLEWLAAPDSWIVDGLTWSETIGARVTNHSYGAASVGALLTTKFAQTRAAGMIHFASAGNEGVPMIKYPARLDSVNGIAALDPRTGELSDFVMGASNYGAGLAFSAPGSLIMTTDRTGDDGFVDGYDYIAQSGTSFASPLSAGVAALILSLDPTLSPDEVEQIMQQSAVDLGDPGYDIMYGWGMVNAFNATNTTMEALCCNVEEAPATCGETIDCDANGIADECDTEVGFASHTMAMAGGAPHTANAADIDGDGDADVILGAAGNATVAWYPNSDGHGAFGPMNLITDDANQVHGVVGADLDGDGDTDVLAALEGATPIVWFDNTDGLGSFDTPQAIATEGAGVWSLVAADIDGDNDLDVVAASADDNIIAWYENIDGDSSFGPRQIISATADSARAVCADDLDGDGDLDVVSASRGDVPIAWYENMDGHGSFGAPRIISQEGGQSWAVVVADVDGDDDLDVIGASFEDRTIAWYANIDGDGAFGPGQPIAVNLSFPSTVLVAVDMDGDSDVDVLSASLFDDTILWFDNVNGGGSFLQRSAISTPANGTRTVSAADLDGDADMDVLAALLSGSTIPWYANSSDDCNGNRTPDECELAAGITADCNANSILDECDIALGISTDEDGDGVPDECPCTVTQECADRDANSIRDDGCMWWDCVAGTCVGTATRFADLGGAFGACAPDGVADGNDRYHVLNCFADTNTVGSPGYECEPQAPLAFNVDAAGLDDPCAPDGVCDLHDAIATLNAFSGVTPCACPAGGAPAPAFTPKGAVTDATIALDPEVQRLRPQATVSVRAFLRDPLPDLRGYQLHLGVEGGTSGTLKLVDITIETRKDAVFFNRDDWRAFNVHTGQMLAGIDGEGIETNPQAYLATFVFRASNDAAGRFSISLFHDDADPAQRTFLLPGTQGNAITVAPTIPAVIEVGRAHSR